MTPDWRDDEKRIIQFPRPEPAPSDWDGLADWFDRQRESQRDPQLVVARTIIAFAMHELPPEKQQRIVPWFCSMFQRPTGEAS